MILKTTRTSAGRRGIAARALATLLPALTCSAIHGSAAPLVNEHSSQIPRITATVDLNHGVPANVVSPSTAIGAALDGMNEGDIDQVYNPANLKAMRAADLHSITYRLRTELGIEAWHWNPQGQWSDRVHKQGYWTSSTTSTAPIKISNGYWLPRRGNTFDQANNEGYSRLDDGSTSTFWKSNPYLSRPFAQENHPQWIIVEFAKPEPIDILKIAWATPFATKFDVQYFASPDDPASEDINDTLNSSGHWQGFANGSMANGMGGLQTLRVASSPVTIKFLRIRLLQSSGGPQPTDSDVRDTLGYAVRELYAGTTDNAGNFQDVIRHGASSAHQTIIYVSSTDSWHRATDLDRDTEQPGFDRILKSGLTAGQPMMLPISLFYGTPENAVAEVKYMRSHGCPVKFLELGEEPDGQYLAPEDYGALFIRFAAALHKYDPTLKLGGPCFQGMTWTAEAWPDDIGTWLWTPRFINYLKSHHKLGELGFWSTESYFFDDIGADPSKNILTVPGIVNRAVADYHKGGVPKGLPLFVTEYGYSPYATEAEVDLPGALLDADFLGTFLAAGGTGAYFYGMEPNGLMLEAKPGATWGNLTMFLSDDSHNIIAPVPAYYALQLVHKWMPSTSRTVRIFPVQTDKTAGQGQEIVTAYAAQREDETWSLMLINKSPKQNFQVDVKSINGRSNQFDETPTAIWQYSAQQYKWKANGAQGRPILNLPPVRVNARAGVVDVPAYSITVVNWGPGE